jgi:hypothetical protein
MGFERLFEGRQLPEIKERIGVMSVDTLNRIWQLVCEENGYLVAIAKDHQDALIGRMGKRDDGKFCIERVMKARLEGNTLRDYEFWYVDAADRENQTHRLTLAIQSFFGSSNGRADR